jgi:predicted nucleotidyltransferase
LVATPLWSYRVRPEHRDILKNIADALKRDPGLAHAFEAVLAQKSREPAPSLGRFKDEEAALGFIRDRLVLSLDPDMIWLFGSRARGEGRTDSDFDILVVLPDAIGRRAADYRSALEPLLGSGLPCDVVPCSSSDFEKSKDVPGTIAREAFRSGRLLYEKRRRRTGSRHRSSSGE